ncbi:MAG: hypothetical protein LBQ82_09560 [Treponema sp.]|jgi:hypothetical protein|nr:hypothetical protein [Treponema sp.]
MATNRRFPRYLLLIALFFIGAASLLQAQTAGYFMQMEDGKPRFIQRLVWHGGENALRYEALIERQEDGNFRRYLLESTTLSYMYISLPPGEYRFCIITYDILDRPVETSPWVPLEVRPALQPEILPTPAKLIESADDRFHSLEFDAKNVVPDAEIFLRRQDGTLVAPISTVVAGNGSLRLHFNREQLLAGEYELIVINPGGLEASTDVVIVEVEVEQTKGIKPLGFVICDMGMSFSPQVISLYGNAQPLYVAFAAHINTGFKVPSGIHIGPEFTVSVMIDEELDQSLEVGFNLLIKKWMAGERMAFNFRIGAEYGVLPEELSDIEKIKSNIGVSFFWLVYNKFYVEAGVEHLNYFVYNAPNGFMRLRFGFGVQF